MEGRGRGTGAGARLTAPGLSAGASLGLDKEREKTPADKLLFSGCVVFLCINGRVNRFGVSRSQQSVSNPAEINR